MSKSRLPLYLGLTAAGAGGYYLYKSGGDIDAAKARAKGTFITYTPLLGKHG